MKLTKKLSLDKNAVKYAAAFSLLFMFAAHAFCFFNLTYSSGAVMLSVSSGRSAQIAGGSVLQPLYFRLRGSISSPLLVGMLSTLYLTLSNVVLVWLLGLRRPLPILALCGAMTANAAVTSVCAGALNTADAVFLAMLLAALAAACCLRMPLGALVGAVPLTAALGLDPTAASFFAALTLIVLLGDLMTAHKPKAFLRGLGALLLTLALGTVLYALGDLLMLRRSGLDQQAALQTGGTGLAGIWLAPIRALLAPLTAYASLSVVLRALLVLLAALAFAASVRSLGTSCALLAVLGALALPLVCNLPIFSADTVPQITMAYCLLDVFLITLLARLAPENVRTQKLAAYTFGVIFLGSIVFSNQVYLKKNLEFESTLSLMSRVIQRIEETEGYHPGYTPVAVIGTPEDSLFSVERKGFEHLSALDASSGNYAVSTDEDMIWYSWEVLGYPLNFVSTFELEQLKEDEAVRALPSFPDEDCCTFIGETLVIKLS
ncbi:MAG: glucosyltransferase domain-containing protein [Candidatus Ventricola sp.]